MTTTEAPPAAPTDPTASRPMFDLSPELAARVEETSLQPHLDHMRDEGYTIIPDIASQEFTARLRETCLRLAQETDGRLKGRMAAMLLGRDPIFEEVVTNPTILTLAEVMCGKGFLLSQLIASVRPKGDGFLPLHSDQGWMPAPFPAHNQLLTLCWTMEDFTLEGGCTKVIPKTHLNLRHPNTQEMEDEPGAIPTTCPPSSIACWDGRVWHGNYPRQIDGERVVLHITFSRLALRTVERYDFLDDEWLEGKPEVLRQLLGRDDFFGSSTVTSGGADGRKIAATFARSRQ